MVSDLDRTGNRRVWQDPDKGKREKQGERYKDEEDGKENSDENVA